MTRTPRTENPEISRELDTVVERLRKAERRNHWLTVALAAVAVGAAVFAILGRGDDRSRPSVEALRRGALL